MSKNAGKHELLKPFRILLNLLDKPEVGSIILEDVLIEAFQNLYLNYHHFNPNDSLKNKNRSDIVVRRNGPIKQVSSKENPVEELIKTGNLLFNTFEPYFMWQYIAKLLASCNKMSQTVGDVSLDEIDPSRESHPPEKATLPKSDPAHAITNGNETLCNGVVGGNSQKDDVHTSEDAEVDENDGELAILDVIRLTDFILDIVALVRLNSDVSKL